MQSFELLSPLIDRSTKVSENEMYKTTDYLRNGVLYHNKMPIARQAYEHLYKMEEL